MNERELVQLAIKQCTNCELSIGLTPVPFFSPVKSPKVAIIGQGPSATDVKKGTPWVGPAGRLTRKLLAEGGLDTQDMGFLNLVCCDDKPTNRHIEACRSNFTMQMEALRPAYALVFGAVAVQGLLPFPVRLTQIRGTWWKLSTGQWAIATYHPANMLYRDAGNQEHTIREDINTFATTVLLGDLALPKKSEICLHCFRWAEGYINEVGFCRDHYPKKKRGKKKLEQMTLFQELP